jgi:hypothetical protein
MENRNIINQTSISKHPPLEQLLVLRLELESKRRQEIELKVKDSERLIDKMSKLTREQETRENLILDLRKKAALTAHDGSGMISDQLAISERTVKLIQTDLETVQEKYIQVQNYVHIAEQDLLDKRLEVNKLAKVNLELEGKLGKLEGKVKESWAEEDRLLDELHMAGDKIGSLEQDELETGFENFNRIAVLEETVRLMQIMGVCKELVLEIVIGALDQAKTIK